MNYSKSISCISYSNFHSHKYDIYWITSHIFYEFFTTLINNKSHQLKIYIYMLDLELYQRALSYIKIYVQYGGTYIYVAVMVDSSYKSMKHTTICTWQWNKHLIGISEPMMDRKILIKSYSWEQYFVLCPSLCNFWKWLYRFMKHQPAKLTNWLNHLCVVSIMQQLLSTEFLFFLF